MDDKEQGLPLVPMVITGVAATVIVLGSRGKIDPERASRIAHKAVKAAAGMGAGVTIELVGHDKTQQKPSDSGVAIILAALSDAKHGQPFGTNLAVMKASEALPPKPPTIRVRDQYGRSYDKPRSEFSPEALAKIDRAGEIRLKAFRMLKEGALQRSVGNALRQTFARRPSLLPQVVPMWLRDP